MELNFLGRGSAFNTHEGNTSAYYKNKDNMLLIDCGETVFSKLIETKTLDDVKNLFVVITHTHPDHIGSLGTLIFYFNLIKKKNLNLVLTPESIQNDIIKQYLKISGVNDQQVNNVAPEAVLKHFPEFLEFKFLSTTHSKNMIAFGLLFNHKKDGITYYSGDTNCSSYLETYLQKPNLDKIYIDTSKYEYENSPHLSILTLQSVVPVNMRNKVHCMHIDDSSFIKEIKQMGFNVVKNVKSITLSNNSPEIEQ